MTRTIPVNQNLVDMEYAVRGPIPLRAMDLQKEGRTIYACNIGNPQALKQKPISCLLYTSPSPRDQRGSRMPSSA